MNGKDRWLLVESRNEDGDLIDVYEHEKTGVRAEKGVPDGELEVPGHGDA